MTTSSNGTNIHACTHACWLPHLHLGACVVRRTGDRTAARKICLVGPHGWRSVDTDLLHLGGIRSLVFFWKPSYVHARACTCIRQTHGSFRFPLLASRLPPPNASDPEQFIEIVGVDPACDLSGQPFDPVLNRMNSTLARRIVVSRYQIQFDLDSERLTNAMLEPCELFSRQRGFLNP